MQQTASGASYGRVHVQGAIVFSGKRHNTSFGIPLVGLVNCLHEGRVLPRKSAHNIRHLSAGEADTCRNKCGYACQ